MQHLKFFERLGKVDYTLLNNLITFLDSFFRGLTLSLKNRKEMMVKPGVLHQIDNSAFCTVNEFRICGYFDFLSIANI